MPDLGNTRTWNWFGISRNLAKTLHMTWKNITEIQFFGEQFFFSLDIPGKTGKERNTVFVHHIYI